MKKKEKVTIPLGWSIPKEYLEQLREIYEVEVLTYGAGDDTDTDRVLSSDDREDELTDDGAAADSSSDRGLKLRIGKLILVIYNS